MKMKLYNMLLLLLWLPAALMASDNDDAKYDKSKTLKKEYSVNANAKLDINNRYGDVNIISWNENRILIEVKIEVSGDDEALVDKRLNSITVDFQGTQSLVSAKTKIEKISSGWGKNNSIHYKINYTVKMPLTNQLEVDNDYGAIYLNELKGRADLNCDYGNLYIGDLKHADNVINIDYCNGSTIKNMNGGTINADYSKFMVSNAGTVKLTADYSSSEFESVDDLNYNCDYGSLRVENSSSVDGVSDYLSLKFGQIKKRLHAEADYGSIRVESLGDRFESVQLKTSYCGIKLGIPTTAFNFKLDLSFSGFSYDSANFEFTNKTVKSTSKYYEGYYKAATSKAKIDIEADYGGVTFKN